jgi:hypothetical protein
LVIFKAREVDMKYDPNNILPVGTRVMLIKDIPQNNAKVGMVGTVTDNKIFEFTYSLKMDSLDKPLLVYSSEIEVYDNLIIPDQLSVL